MTQFLQDEVRSGFYIPTAIKQAWTVQLKILSEIDRICSKYDIRYFADWGTYLGAVRHGGFVPWDDDLDICMLREDYERFKQVAKSELQAGYAVHNFETKENHWLFLARVVNTDSICFDKKHLDENYNFPYIATVDIFILDYLYEDEEEERKRCDEVKHIIALADGIVQGTLGIEVAADMLAKLEQRYGLTAGNLSGHKSCCRMEKNVGMDSNVVQFGNYLAAYTPEDDAENRRQIGIALYRLAEAQMGRTPKDKSKHIGQIFPWVLKGNRGLPREYYDKSIRLPFEFTTIPVPAYYHAGLAGRYGEYMRVHKIWGGHDYPYFEKQRENLQAVADFKLPEFTFKADMLRENQPATDKGGSLKAMAKECLSELENMVAGVCSGFSVAYGGIRYDESDAEIYDMATEGSGEAVNVAVLDVLANCQQLAVDLGTLVEEVKGEKRESTIKAVGSLEGFCETVYGLYMYVQDMINGEECQNENADVSESFGPEQGLRIQDDSVPDKINRDIENKLNELEDSFEKVKENIDKYVINRREVLFVCAGRSRLSGFRGLYDSAVADGDTDVYVVNVPIMRKDAYGNIITGTEDIKPGDDADAGQGNAGNYEQAHSLLLDESVNAGQGKISSGSAYVNHFGTDWKTYSPELHMPDEIFIQDAYDRENPCLTIPEMYYAENLQRYTDKLVFVTPFLVNEFKREDSTDWYNMKHYVTAPGVVRADVIMVQSENMKRNYVEKLTEFAGEETRSIWEEKVVVNGAGNCHGRPAGLHVANAGTRNICDRPNGVNVANVGTQNICDRPDGVNVANAGTRNICDRPNGVSATSVGSPDMKADTAGRKSNKCMMYCIGLNEMLEHGEDIIEKVQERLDIIGKYSDNMEAVVCIYPQDESVWLDVVPEMTEELFGIIKKRESEKLQFIYRQEGRNKKTDTQSKLNDTEYMADMMDGCDAYYGSPTPYAHYFNANGKPVMMCDYSV